MCDVFRYVETNLVQAETGRVVYKDNKGYFVWDILENGNKVRECIPYETPDEDWMDYIMSPEEEDEYWATLDKEVK